MRMIVGCIFTVRVKIQKKSLFSSFSLCLSFKSLLHTKDFLFFSSSFTLSKLHWVHTHSPVWCSFSGHGYTYFYPYTHTMYHYITICQTWFLMAILSFVCKLPLCKHYQPNTQLVLVTLRVFIFVDGVELDLHHYHYGRLYVDFTPSCMLKLEHIKRL